MRRGTRTVYDTRGPFWSHTLFAILSTAVPNFRLDMIYSFGVQPKSTIDRSAKGRPAWLRVTFGCYLQTLVCQGVARWALLLMQTRAVAYIRVALLFGLSGTPRRFLICPSSCTSPSHVRQQAYNNCIEFCLMRHLSPFIYKRLLATIYFRFRCCSIHHPGEGRKPRT
jgi:hypothetical protein